MNRLLPKDQVGTWQLISVNVSCETSADVSMIVESLNARAHMPVILALQETRSWDVPNMELPDYVCYGSKFGLATLVVSDRFSK